MFYELGNPYQTANNFMTISKAEMGCCPNTLKACRKIIKAEDLSAIEYILFTVICMNYGGMFETAQHKLYIPEKYRDAENFDPQALQDYLNSMINVPIYEVRESIPIAKQETDILCSGFGGKDCPEGGPSILVEETTEGEGEDAITMFCIVLDTDIQIDGYQTTDGNEVNGVVEICEKQKVCEIAFTVQKTETYELSNPETGDVVVLGPFESDDVALAQFEAGLGMLGLNYVSGEAVTTVAEGICKIHIKTPDYANLLLNGKPGTDCGCEDVYVQSSADPVMEKMRAAELAKKSNGGVGNIQGLKITKLNF